MNWKPYPKYKDSGVEWLGQVPEHWGVRKASHLFNTIGSGTTPPSDDPQWYEGDIPWVTTGELREGLISDTEKHVGRHTVSAYSALRVYAPGTLLIAMYGATIGRLGILKVPATTNQACCALSESKGCDPRFVFFLFQAFRDQIITLASGGGQPNINQDKVRQFRIATPPPHEQQFMLAFLDRETVKIDTLIAKQQRLIELLQEKRQALISHAVTKGLNPDAPMKPSGIEWLGDVPAHWEIAGLTKYLESVIDYRGRTPRKTDEGIQLVTARNIKVGFIDYQVSMEFTPEEDALRFMLRGQPAIGDVLFTTEAPLGQAATVDREDIVLAQRIIKLRGLHGVLENSFLKYWILGSACQFNLIQLATGSTALGIKGSKLSQVRLLLPPLSEQKEIVSHIESRLAAIAGLDSKTNRAIALMREHRTALISAAVTGKIDVREAHQAAHA